MHAHPIFIAATALWVAGMPATVQAEQPKHIPQIGFLLRWHVPIMIRRRRTPFKDAAPEGLNALGYVEGKNIHVDYRVPRKPEEIAEMARDLVGHKVDIIATGGPQRSKPPGARPIASRSSLSLAIEPTGWSPVSPGLGAT